MHLPAWAVVGRYADLNMPLDQTSPIVITSTFFLAWALIVSGLMTSDIIATAWKLSPRRQ